MYTCLLFIDYYSSTRVSGIPICSQSDIFFDRTICCCPNHQAITYSVARVVITSTAITREEENCAVMSTRNLWSLSTFLGKSRCFEGAQRAFLSAQSKYIFDLVSPKANGWVSSRRFDLAFL